MLSTVFEHDLVETGAGYAVLRIRGARAAALFASEPGGHRWQRVPPTEKHGRVQTSTVTVAVLDDHARVSVEVRDDELQIRTCRGSGKGGQHRNKTDSAVHLTHRPTGLSVRCESERSQTQNKQTARALLHARLLDARRSDADAQRASARQQQVGSGMRGDKIRTIRAQDDQVTDHRSGRTWTLRAYLKGQW